MKHVVESIILFLHAEVVEGEIGERVGCLRMIEPVDMHVDADSLTLELHCRLELGFLVVDG